LLFIDGHDEECKYSCPKHQQSRSVFLGHRSVPFRSVFLLLFFVPLSMISPFLWSASVSSSSLLVEQPTRSFLACLSWREFFFLLRSSFLFFLFRFALEVLTKCYISLQIVSFSIHDEKSLEAFRISLSWINFFFILFQFSFTYVCLCCHRKFSKPFISGKNTEISFLAELLIWKEQREQQQVPVDAQFPCFFYETHNFLVDLQAAMNLSCQEHGIGFLQQDAAHKFPTIAAAGKRKLSLQL
jgi:hypothetical protein